MSKIVIIFVGCVALNLAARYICTQIGLSDDLAITIAVGITTSAAFAAFLLSD